MDMVMLHLNQIIIPPGQYLWLQDINWKTFEIILDQLNETRKFRLAYCNNILEIMSPLPWHEDSKNIIADFIKIAIEEMGLEFRALGSTTFKHPSTGKAIEPDECFYIEHEALIRGKARINLTQEPPPDLVLEIDYSSHTHLHIYQVIGVPEVWRYVDDALLIYVLQDGCYMRVETSLHFPHLNMCAAIPKFLIQSRVQGRSSAIKAFRSWIKHSNHV
jgi:Uma2 family endonuclease